MNFSLRQLRAFLALVEHRNFTRAAEQSFLSQPAFSALIRSLEDELGVRLFDRNTRKVIPTSAGERFELGARRILREADAAIADLGEPAAGKSVRVAAMPSLSARTLPSILGKLREREPDIAVSLFDALPDRCVAMTRAKEVDFALTTLETMAPDLACELLCTDRFHLVCRSDHELAGLDEVDLRQLEGLPFVHFSASTRLRHQIDTAMLPLRVHAVMEIERLEAVRGLVESGVGVSLVPAVTLFHFDSPNLRIVPLGEPGISRDIFCVRLKDRPLSDAAAQLWTLVLENPPTL